MLVSLPLARAAGADPANGKDAENAADTARDVAHSQSRTARADLPARLADDDTADGRVDGDLGLVFGLGVAVAGSPRGAAEVRLRYLETAGIFATYEDGFGGPDPLRVFAAGLELRPLFLGRWVTGRELGIRWMDLVLDSFGMEIGTFFEQTAHAPMNTPPGLQAGLGLELPLIGTVNGPWIDIHAGARWSDVVLEGGAVRGPTDRAVFVTVTVAYHRVFGAHVVDVNDRAP